ncbi:MAG TPA: hypothetical protein VF763_01530 [Candidatus Limnocylindrales bacterium]
MENDRGAGSAVGARGPEPTAAGARTDASASSRVHRPGPEGSQPPSIRPAHPLVASPPARRSYLVDLAWRAALAGTKALTIGFALDALFHPDAPRLRGKAIRTRAFGYTACLFIVPLAWQLRGRRDRYPRELDLAVAVPLLLDAAGNGMGIYEHAHVDDIVHFANGAILASVGAALAEPRVAHRAEAALFGAQLGISGEMVWEVAEYAALKAGATGMGLTYDDTLADIIESTLGAILGAVIGALHARPAAAAGNGRPAWRAEPRRG